MIGMKQVEELDTCSICERLKWVGFHSPYSLNVLPAGDTSHGSFLVFGSAMHRQQLGSYRTKLHLMTGNYIER